MDNINDLLKQAYNKVRDKVQEKVCDQVRDQDSRKITDKVSLPAYNQVICQIGLEAFYLIGFKVKTRISEILDYPPKDPPIFVALHTYEGTVYMFKSSPKGVRSQIIDQLEEEFEND